MDASAPDQPPVGVSLDKTPRKKELFVKIWSPFKTYYADVADSLSAVNTTGPFDILPEHKDFMCLLGNGKITVRAASGVQEILIARGVLHVHDNKVVVFLDV